MNDDLDELLVQSGLPAEGFGEVIGLLEAWQQEPVAPPTPSPELAALLGRGQPAAQQVSPRRRAGTVVAAVVLGLTGTTMAAAANVLPARVQEAVAGFSEVYLPFRLPHPDGPGGQPPGGPLLDAPSETPVATPSSQAEGRPGREPGRGERSPAHDTGGGEPSESAAAPGPPLTPSAPADPGPISGSTSGQATADTPSGTPGGPPDSPGSELAPGSPGADMSSGPDASQSPGGPAPPGPTPQQPTDGTSAPVGTPDETDPGLLAGVLGSVLALASGLLGA